LKKWRGETEDEAEENARYFFSMWSGLCEKIPGSNPPKFDDKGKLLNPPRVKCNDDEVTKLHNDNISWMKYADGIKLFEFIKKPDVNTKLKLVFSKIHGRFADNVVQLD